MRTSSFDDLLRDLGLERGGRAERQAVGGALLHRADHVVVRVTQDRRAPGADVVDVLRALRGPDVRALGLREEHGFAAHAAEGADGRVDATGDVAGGFLVQFAGRRHGIPPDRQFIARETK